MDWLIGFGAFALLVVPVLGLRYAINRGWIEREFVVGRRR